MSGLRAFVVLTVLLPAPVKADSYSDLCISSAKRAAAQTGVSEELLVAVTIAETRKEGSPWPWTINHGGKGAWYRDRASAEMAAREMVAAGGTPDIGCFQLNTRWHGEAFPSVEAMFDPDANALYAAGFLRDLYAEAGDWPRAVAAYHSRDPDRGDAYMVRVGEILASMAPDRRDHASPPLPRRNSFPLLVAGRPSMAGSLVPATDGRPPLIGAP